MRKSNNIETKNPMAGKPWDFALIAPNAAECLMNEPSI
jgi:hypothetical protein